MWQRIIFLCCFVLLAQVPDSVRGQGLVLAPIDIAWPVALNATCVPKSTVIDRIPTPCLPYITYDSIYVDYNQATREKLGRITISNSWSSPACINASYRIGCLYMFRPCVEVPVPGTNGTTTNETTAVARYMCREGCKQVYNVCYDAIYASLKVVGHLEQLQAATSCDPPWFVMYGQNLPGVQTFPDTTQYSVPVTNDNYTTPVFYTNMTCYSDNLNVTTEPPYNICPTGLYYTEGTCALLCPEPLLSDSEFNAVAGITGGFGWFSFLLMILLMFSFLLEHKRRTFPHDLFIYFVASLLLLSFSFVIASVIGFRKMDCEDDKTPNTWGAGGCTIQGILYVYFSLTSVFWWLVISFNYFLLIVMGYQSKPLMAWREWLTGIINGGADWRPWFRWETIYVCYHIFSWGVPLLPLIISLAAHRLGYGGHDVWCTIHSGEDSIVRWEIQPLGGLKHVDGDPRNLWHVILFDVPIFCAVCLGCGLLLTVVVYGAWKAKGKVWTRSFFKQHWRMILFLGFYFYIYVFVFSFHIHQSVEREAQYEAYDDYIDCSFNKDILNGVDYVINCPLDHVINFPLWVIMALNVASQGVIAFLILGTTRVLVHQFWWFISIPFVLLKLMEPIPLDLPEKNETGGPEVVGDPKDDVKEMDTYYSDDDVAPVRN